MTKQMKEEIRVKCERHADVTSKIAENDPTKMTMKYMLQGMLDIAYACKALTKDEASKIYASAN